MIHYVKRHDPVGGQAACGICTLEHRAEQVTTQKKLVTCPKCRAVLTSRKREAKGSGGA